MFGRRKRNEGTETYLALRAMALDAVANGLAGPPGVVIDVPAQDGFMTLVALSDGTTSLYTSTGGGMIGAGEHESVARATQALLTAARANLARFPQSETDGLPNGGLVRVHVLMPTSRHHADIPEDAFWGRTSHDLHPVIAAAQNAITAVRALSGYPDTQIQ